MNTWPEQKAAEAGLPKPQAQKLRKAWLQEVAASFSAGNEAAQWLGMRDGSLRRMAVQHGVDLPKGHSGFKPWIPVDEIRRLAGQGLVAPEIASRLGCSRCQVWALARNNGIKLSRMRDIGRSVEEPPAPKPAPGSMAEFAVRENRAMRKVGMR